MLVVFLSASGILGAAGPARGTGGTLLWEVATGGVLAASNGRVVVAGSAGVQVFDGKSGTLLWRDPFLGATTVAIDAQQVVVVGGNTIRVYNAQNGAQNWQGLLNSGTVIRGAEIRGNKLFVTGTAMDSTGVAQLFTRAYDTRTGQITWQDQSLPSNAIGFAFTAQSPLTIYGTNVYIAATVGYMDPLVSRTQAACVIRAYDLNSGTLVWESFIQKRCISNAIKAHKKQVILAGIAPPFGFFSPPIEDFMVRSYNALTGELLWQDQTNVFTGLDNQAIAVDDEGKRAFVGGWVWCVFCGTSGQEFLIRAYNMETGERYWEDQYPGVARKCFCQSKDIVVKNGLVFAVGSFPFIVRAYNAKEGNVLWTNELPTGLAESVAVDQGVVFAADSGILRAFDAK